MSRRADLYERVVRTTDASESELAILLGVTERHVRRIRASIRAADAEAELHRAAALSQSRAVLFESA
jgi:hypothetical protein